MTPNRQGMATWKPVGRMGNSLFQAAATMAYAWRHGLEYSVPIKTNDPKANPLYLQHLANPRFNYALPSVVVEEKGHGFQEIPFREEWRNRNIILHGYWQSEKYFKDYRDRILEAFGFPWELQEGVVSVHVRRGDYLTIKKGGMFKHPPVTKQWYERAMAKFPDMKFKFFSDDLGWCQEQFGERLDCTFSDEVNEVADLIAGSNCEHHISSASTFGWWMSWLGRNENKRVILPTHWITPGWGNLDMKDIVPTEWERM